MLAGRVLVAALAGIAAGALAPAEAFDLQRFAAVRTGAAAADRVALRALQSFDGPDLAGADGPMARAGLDLALLYHEHADYVARGRPGAFATTVLGARVAGERVLVEALIDSDAVTARNALAGLGLAGEASGERIVSGWLPLTALDAASRLAGVRALRPAAMLTSTGLALSQGDLALAAAAARAAFGVNGSGVTVGAISDSFNCRGGYVSDIGTGDLPGGVTVLEELSGCGGTDEGRAMLQIVHDLAPGAALAFHAGFNGTASFANGIGELVQAGADVIVDDVAVLTEPMFQDGTIALAADAAVAAGAAYFSAAGNNVRQAYESAFRLTNVNGYRGRRHDFDASGATDTLQSFRLSAGATAYISLQWDQPFFSVSGNPGAATDLEAVVYDANGSALGASGMLNVGGDAVDILVFQNSGSTEVTWQLAIERRGNGPAPASVKYVYFVVGGTLKLLEYATSSGAIFGHANAAGVRAVAAVNYSYTPAYGTLSPILAPYSSRGGTTIRLSSTGAPVSILRRKPEFAAVDGVDTTFFGSGDVDATGFPNFYGTSAAAPHAAGVAALARARDPAAAPTAIYAALLDTAIDMGSAGFDDDSGGGLVQAERVVGYAAANAAEGAWIAFGSTPAGTVLDGAFGGDVFAGLGVTIEDSDAAAGTSLLAWSANGGAGIAGAYLHLPSSGVATWVDLEFVPSGRDVRFDFAAPLGQIALTAFDQAGAPVGSWTASGATPFAGPDGSSWQAGSVALPAAVSMSRLRVAPANGAGPLAIDNLSFTTSAAPAVLVAADVPIPLPALVAAGLAIVAIGRRRLSGAERYCAG